MVNGLLKALDTYYNHIIVLKSTKYKCIYMWCFSAMLTDCKRSFKASRLQELRNKEKAQFVNFKCGRGRFI